MANIKALLPSKDGKSNYEAERQRVLGKIEREKAEQLDHLRDQRREAERILFALHDIVSLGYNDEGAEGAVEGVDHLVEQAIAVHGAEILSERFHGNGQLVVQLCNQNLVWGEVPLEAHGEDVRLRVVTFVFRVPATTDGDKTQAKREEK